MAHPYPAARVVAAASIATPIPMHNLLSRQQFVLGFLAGGFVCSAAMLAITAYFTLGEKNFKRIMEFRKTVFQHVWGIFWLGLRAAKANLVLRRDSKSKWHWGEAWKVLKESMNETKRAAREGVEAIRLEANLYAASVGKPGLVALQYSVNHLTPKFFANAMEESLRDTLETAVRDNDSYVDRVELVEFAVGEQAPELLDARAYELGDDAMAFDLDIKWDSGLEATMSMRTKTRIAMTVPITVRNFHFDGVLRVVLSPLTPDPPGYGAALISLPAAPNIELDVRMAGGEITRMPWLRSEILSTLQKCIEDQFLWPRRLVIPSPRRPLRSKKVKTMLSKRELQALEYDDPLLRAEQKLARDLDGLHHQIPPREHQIVAKERGSVSLHTDIQLKDAECIEALGGGQESEELCIIDWDSFEEVASSSPQELSSKEEQGGTLKKNLFQVLRNTFSRP